MLLSILLVLSAGVLAGFAIALLGSSEERRIRMVLRGFVLACSVLIVGLCIEAIARSIQTSKEIEAARIEAVIEAADQGMDAIRAEWARDQAERDRQMREFDRLSK